MKKYIVYQSIVSEEELNKKGEWDIKIGTIVRVVRAKSENESIQKFMADTVNIKAVKKLEIYSSRIRDIITI